MPVDDRTSVESLVQIDGMLPYRVDLQISSNVAMRVGESLLSMPEVSVVNVVKENSIITFSIKENEDRDKVLRRVTKLEGNAKTIVSSTFPLSLQVEDSAIVDDKADEMADEKADEKDEEIKEEESKERKSSSRVLELDRPWTENYTSSLQGSSFHIYQKKCAQLHSWVKLAEEVINQSSTCASTAGEFCAASKRAKYLVEECSHDLWLLKAVELWECEEHFVEVLLDLCWSAYIMSFGVGNIEGSEKWMNHVEELLNSRTEQNDMTRLFHGDCMVDKGVLNVMVEAKLADKNLVVNGPEHELGQLLRDRLGNTNLWRPQFLRRYSFNIYWKIIFSSVWSSRTGASGAILTQRWVYGKEFALKTRCRGSDDKVSFEREFDILDKYRSPYIVEVVGYWELDVTPIPGIFRTVRYPFLLMEILECNLKDLIHKCKSSRDQGSREGFSALETINLMLPVAKALRFVHEKDVAHRDVKPENIMCKNVNIMNPKDLIVIKEDVVVKLIDFGEARESVPEIRDGEWGRAGTSGYMDPTMWNQDAVGYTLFMGDVFSFAMAFAELLTWKSPSEAFGVREPKDAQIRLKAGERPSLPHDLRIPRYLKFIVESCWAADHLRRPDFTDICSMLQHAKVLLSEHNDFDCKLKDIFLYVDPQGIERCINSDET